MTTLYPSEGFYASEEPTQGSVGHLIGGQPVSHVAVNAGVTRDVWTRDRAEHRNAAAEADRRRWATRRSPTSIPERGSWRSRRWPRAYMKSPPPGAVPPDRLAAGDVDLDRRPDRRRWRPDRDLAGAERRPSPCERALARPRRARPGTRLSRAGLRRRYGVEFLIAIMALALLVVVILVDQRAAAPRAPTESARAARGALVERTADEPTQVRRSAAERERAGGGARGEVP